jgi:trans-2,3-dihydro-3-hydroxyanthranilate isomerase
MPRRYVTADVFADRPFAGNPLAVVLDATGLSTVQMQAVANEFGYAETTFVLPARGPGQPAHVGSSRRASRCRSPASNVRTAVVLARRARRDGRALASPLRFEEAAGLVVVELVEEENEIVGAELMAPEPLSWRDTDRPNGRRPPWSLTADDIATDRHPPGLLGRTAVSWSSSCGRGMRCAAQRLTLRQSARLMPLGDADAIGATPGTCRRRGPGHLDVQARMFSPLDGTGEDRQPAAAQPPPAGLWAPLLPATASCFRVGQGFDMGRPSILLPRGDQAQRRDRVGTSAVGAVEMMRGTFELDGDEAAEG